MSERFSDEVLQRAWDDAYAAWQRASEHDDADRLAIAAMRAVLEGHLAAQAVDERTLDNADLAGYGRRIADASRSRLEASDPVWQHLPDFRTVVAEEAATILASVVLHQRLQAKRGCQ